MSDSFIIDVPALQAASAAITKARASFKLSYGRIDQAFKGIEWTDDNGESFQEQVTKFKQECDKVAGRLSKNAITLSKAANAAEPTQAEIKTQVGRLYA